MDTTSFNSMALKDKPGQSQSDAVYLPSFDLAPERGNEGDMIVVDNSPAPQPLHQNSQASSAMMQSVLVVSSIGTSNVNTTMHHAIGIHQSSRPVPPQKPRKQCVVCLWFNCRQKNQCSDSDGRKRCGCGHDQSEVPAPPHRIYRPGPKHRDKEIN